LKFFLFLLFLCLQPQCCVSKADKRERERGRKKERETERERECEYILDQDIMKYPRGISFSFLFSGSSCWHHMLKTHSHLQHNGSKTEAKAKAKAKEKGSSAQTSYPI
jgi:hypothetical protein